MSVLWPRLERTVAATVLDRLQGLNPEEIQSAPALFHPAQTFASTGGVRAGEGELGRLREGIVEVASDFGFPNPGGDLVGFDRTMAVRLLELMPMAQAEALVRPVWSFAALVLAPDVTHWRFVATRRASWNAERWVCTDRTRHMFARLWWQARQLAIPREGRLDASLLQGLSESELNHLTERTSIGGCGPLVRALARAVLELPVHDRNRDVVRLGAMLLLRRCGVVDPYSLADEELHSIAKQMLDQATGLPSLPLPVGLAADLPPPINR